jgi:hypothetical protein
MKMLADPIVTCNQHLQRSVDTECYEYFSRSNITIYLYTEVHVRILFPISNLK